MSLTAVQSHTEAASQHVMLSNYITSALSGTLW